MKIYFRSKVLSRSALFCTRNYLIIDCTQAGKKCRPLMIALAYHGTALPIAWKTVKGKKGHVKGRIHQELLKRIYPYFRYYRRVMVLGDAEFSNESVISWLQSVGWGFVLRFQESYLVQTTDTPVWQTAWGAYQVSQLEPGQVRHWENVRFTMDHKIPGLTMTAYWQEGEEAPLGLISNLPASEQPHLIYEKRFWIETSSAIISREASNWPYPYGRSRTLRPPGVGNCDCDLYHSWLGYRSCSQEENVPGRPF